MEENDGYFFENYFSSNYDIVKAIAGNEDYDIHDEYVTLDCYDGTIVSYSESEYEEMLQDNISEIAECLIENLAHVDLNSELRGIVNKLYV